jgi:DNA-binding transcriptional MerR regulator
MKRYSISGLAREFGLSRSTLLYYDSLGLLKPETRTAANYRVYSERERERLKRISDLRKTGVPLEKIREVIDADLMTTGEVLKERCIAINREIAALRFQQQVILTLIDREELKGSTRIMTRDSWVELLKAAGLDEEGMHRWHLEFEKTAPEAHRDFLESIGLTRVEVEQVKAWSRRDLHKA